MVYLQVSVFYLVFCTVFYTLSFHTDLLFASSKVQRLLAKPDSRPLESFLSWKIRGRVGPG